MWVCWPSLLVYTQENIFSFKITLSVNTVQTMKETQRIATLAWPEETRLVPPGMEDVIEWT